MDLVLSQNLRLRRLAVKDHAAFVQYRADPKVARYQGWDTMNAAEAERFLAHMAQAPLLTPGKWTQLGIAARQTDALLGDIGVHLAGDQSEAELGITLSRAAQGQSLGFEAVTLVCDWLFDQVPIGRIVAITHARNAAALALLARTPFEHTHDTHDVIDGVETPECWFELRRS